MKNKKELTQREVAAKGGRATLKKYGKKHFRKMARVSWEKRSQTKKPPASK